MKPEKPPPSVAGASSAYTGDDTVSLLRGFLLLAVGGVTVDP